MVIIGLTGGIASGKSTLSKSLNSQGFHIIDADKLGHEAYAPGSPLIPQLIQNFGDEIVQNGTIHRPTLRKIVFECPERLKRLTDLVWPRIFELIQKCVEDLQQGEANSIIVLEAAVLLEAGWASLVDYVILLESPDEVEIRERILRRNPEMTREDITKAICSQLSQLQRIRKLEECGKPYSVIKSAPKDVVASEVLKIIDFLMRKD